MDNIKQLLKSKINELDESRDKESNQFVNHEFQDYGLRLANELNDYEHKALYIRYAKEVPRALLESTRAFVKLNYEHLPKKGKIFMWKLGQEIEEYKRKHPDFKINLHRRKSKKKKAKKQKKGTKTKKTNQTKKNNQLDLL